MIYRGDNFNEKTFGVVMFPLISIPLFWAVFSVESTIFGKVISGISGLFLLFGPIRSFFFRRYQVLFTEDQIKIEFTSKYVKEKLYTYDQLVSIKFTNPPRGRNQIIFRFEGKGRAKEKFTTELEKKEGIIELILHCRNKNSNTKFDVLPVNGDLFKFIKREMYKQRHKL